jgi:hypothetical protein
MTVHNGVTILVNIDPLRIDKLKQVLQDVVDLGVEDNGLVPFSKISTAHYARWVILDSEPDAYGDMLPAQLLYSATVDGSEKDHINELIAFGRLGLEQIYACCEGFPSGNGLTDSSIFNYLCKGRISSTFYSGIVGISLKRVRDEGCLYERIQSFLDETALTKDLSKMNPQEVRSKIQDFVRGERDLQWALKPSKFSIKSYFQIYGRLSLFILIVIFLLLSLITFIIGNFVNLPATISVIALSGTVIFSVLLLFSILLLLLMRLDEFKPAISFDEATDEQILEMQTKETLLVQAQYTARGNMKPRLIRTIWQTTILFLVKQIAVTSFIPTVHAARWFQINNRKQVVFVSNFDGDSEGYLHGFIDLKSVRKNMNLIYGSSLGFPKTKWLRGEGCTDRQGYMKLTRKLQTQTNVWYCAVKNLSVENIKNNKRIRKGLFGPMSEEKTKQWLRQL